MYDGMLSNGRFKVADVDGVSVAVGCVLAAKVAAYEVGGTLQGIVFVGY